MSSGGIRFERLLTDNPTLIQDLPKLIDRVLYEHKLEDGCQFIAGARELVLGAIPAYQSPPSELARILGFAVKRAERFCNEPRA